MKIQRRVAEIAKKSTGPALRRGYLAEDYDGVGSVVLVQMSRGSSSAIQASVAAGSFGTEQTFPVGTPVMVLEYAGRVEVVSLGSKLSAGALTVEMLPVEGWDASTEVSPVIMPGTMQGAALAPQSIDIALFAQTVRPVVLVTALPSLPDADYPIGAFVYKTDDVPPRLYKNVANAWVAAIGPDDIQANSITAGQIAVGAVSTSELAVGARLTGEVANEEGATPGVFIDETGILIRDGKLTLQDEYGLTVATASGFSGGWAEFIATGLYNPTFASGVVGAVANGRTANLPYWTVARSNLSSVVRVADAAWPGGHYLEATPSALTGYLMVDSDLVPLSAPFGPMVVSVTAACVVGGASEPRIWGALVFYDADGEYLWDYNVTLVAFYDTNTTPAYFESGPLVPPAAAKFASVSIQFAEMTAHDAATRMRLGGALLRPASTVGVQSQAWPMWLGPYANFSLSTSIPVNRALLMPLHIDSALSIDKCIILSDDTTLARSFEWQIYFDADRSAVLHEVPGAAGSVSWTASAVGLRGATIESGVRLRPGTYWLGIRNSHASNTLGIAYCPIPASTAAYGSPTITAYKNTAGAFGPTFDMDSITGTQQLGWGAYLSGWAANRVWG